MYKEFKGRLAFKESVWEQPGILNHFCDDRIILYEYEKDRTFREMCRDIYYAIYNDYGNNINKLNNSYTKSKKDTDLIQINDELRLCLQQNKKIKDILEKFKVVSFIKNCNIFNTNIKSGKFIIYDGNTKILLLENEQYYYYINWSGS